MHCEAGCALRRCLSQRNYQLLRVIGQSYFGDVCLCLNLKNSQKCIIKSIDVRNAKKDGKRAANMECAILLRLQHPNIVEYKSSFIQDAHLYIEMGFCAGGDLDSYLQSRSGQLLDEIEVLDILVQITMALEYVHSKSILHRDLKTKNIFLTESRLIKVGDFGIARILDEPLSLANTLTGTPYYMSPELLTGRPYNHKSDIWSLGCVAYEVTSLHQAFSAQNFHDLSLKILLAKTPSVPQKYSTCLQRLTGAMLRRQPEKRPSARRILRTSYIRSHIRQFIKRMDTSPFSTANTISSLQNNKSTVKMENTSELTNRIQDYPSDTRSKIHDLPEQFSTGGLTPPTISSARQRRRKKRMQKATLSLITDSNSTTDKDAELPCLRQRSKNADKSLLAYSTRTSREKNNTSNKTLNSQPRPVSQASQSPLRRAESSDTTGLEDKSTLNEQKEVLIEACGEGLLRRKAYCQKLSELRGYCLKEIGEERMLAVESLFDRHGAASNLTDNLRDLLGASTYDRCASKIWQLKLLESNL